MKKVGIAPQELLVAAPRSLVFDVVTGLESVTRPGSPRTTSLISAEGARAMVAFSAKIGQQQVHVVKEMTSYPPDRVDLRHLTGPFVGAIESLHLLAVEQDTRLVLSAELHPGQEVPARSQKLTLEQLAHAYLLDVKAAAEQRYQPLEIPGGPFTLLVPVPTFSTEAELLSAIEAQEEAEWGHSGHGRGVARVAVTLAEAVMLPPRQIDHLQRAASLHDLGKIAVDSAIWGTRNTLTPQQRAMMQVHPRLGHDLAARVGMHEMVLSGILRHHERWDGHGYPDRWSGEEIPLRARILFLAEAIDSMLRSTYRRTGMSPEQVGAALDAGAGREWDPNLARRAAQIIRGKLPAL